MTIKTLEIIHDALKYRLHSQKCEYECLESAMNRSKVNAAPEHEIAMNEKITKSALDRLEEISKAIDEFESACVVMGGPR